MEKQSIANKIKELDKIVKHLEDYPLTDKTKKIIYDYKRAKLLMDSQTNKTYNFLLEAMDELDKGYQDGEENSLRHKIKKGIGYIKNLWKSKGFLICNIAVDVMFIVLALSFFLSVKSQAISVIGFCLAYLLFGNMNADIALKTLEEDIKTIKEVTDKLK